LEVRNELCHWRFFKFRTYCESKVREPNDVLNLRDLIKIVRDFENS
jgi:hypothetical protein